MMKQFRSKIALIIVVMLLVLVYIIKAALLILLHFSHFTIILLSLPFLLIAYFLDPSMFITTKKITFNDE